MKFDYYSATVRHPLKTVADCLAAEFEWAEADEVRPSARYDRAIQFNYADERVCKLEGQDATQSVLITASGHHTPKMVGYLRNGWPDHSVSRMDVCQDYTGEGVFESMDSTLVRLALDTGIRLDQAGDWHRQNGRTRYVGAPKSPTRVRLYEKGWQMLEEAKRGLRELPDDFDITRTRLEVQVRPQSRDKAKCASYTAAEVMAYAPWTRQAYALLSGFELAVPLKEVRPRSAHHKKLFHLAKQYSRTLLAELSIQDGSFEGLGKRLIDEVHEIERSVRRAAAIAQAKS